MALGKPQAQGATVFSTQVNICSCSHGNTLAHAGPVVLHLEFELKPVLYSIGTRESPSSASGVACLCECMASNSVRLFITRYRFAEPLVSDLIHLMYLFRYRRLWSGDVRQRGILTHQYVPR